ncbi:MAG: hypothetical protein J3K34DRAFT_515867 [Monoraphidium minutum]|nr:MAG: hypothetical protein J3K34DRAFT_515867 [Monoraphidium minutum]
MELLVQRLRTNWRDLTEHHCPRFGKERTVALPILEPKAASGDIKDYRIQLSFDGDRLVTPWIQVMGGKVLGMPLVVVQLRRVGGELKGARVEVIPLPDEFLLSHSDMFDDFANATHWPKHVLLHYDWRSGADAQFDSGLLVMLVMGLGVAVLVSLNNLAGLQGKLQAFLRDVVGDSDASDPLLPPALTGPAPPRAPGGGGGYGGGGGWAPAAPGGWAPPEGGGGGGYGGYGGGGPPSGGSAGAAAGGGGVVYAAGGAGGGGVSQRYGPPSGSGAGGGGYGAPAYGAPPAAPAYAAPQPPPFKAGSHFD